MAFGRQLIIIRTRIERIAQIIIFCLTDSTENTDVLLLSTQMRGNYTNYEQINKLVLKNFMTI